MIEPKLDWNTAEVREGTLTVELEGKLPSGWKRSFDATAALLNQGAWAKLKVKHHKVRVRGARPGEEEKLRHFLESVVLQANADHRSAEQPESQHNGERARHDHDERQPDVEMTERFRGFAHASSERDNLPGGV
jgi:hypothetical protein